MTLLLVGVISAAMGVSLWLLIPAGHDVGRVERQDVVRREKPATLEIREAAFIEEDASRGLYKVAIKMRNSGDHGIARIRYVFLAATQSLDGPPVWPVDYPHPADVVFPPHTEFTLTSKVVPPIRDDAARLFLYLGYVFEDAETHEQSRGRICLKWDGVDPRSGKFDASFFATSEPEAQRVVDYVRKRGYDVLEH